MSPARELELLRLLQSLRLQLAAAHDEGAIARVFLRGVKRFLAASSMAMVEREPSGALRARWHAGPLLELHDEGLRVYLARGEWPRPVARRLVAPVTRRGRTWVALVADADRAFAAGEGQGLVAIAEILAQRIAELDQKRASDVRARIDRKIMAQLRPQDLCYQILHGLRSLTGYDHSGALYVYPRGGRKLRLAAEQVAWSKRKSARIGLEVELSDEEHKALRVGETCGFDCDGPTWRAWRGSAPPSLLRAVELGPDAPASASILLAPLVAGREPLGLIKLASVHPHSLAGYEADLLHRFLPQASVAIRNAEKTESLKESVLRAERKHAMADLARGVAHDVNNALGCVLPVVQQMRAELRDGVVDHQAQQLDLVRIEDAVTTCRRIFGGMLAFAKGVAGRSARTGNIRRAIENAASILRASAARRGSVLDLELPATLPDVVGAQHELEQLFLNLMSNAYDAMPRGGRLHVVAAPAPDASQPIAVLVRDNGRGMTRAELARIEEAFYTTKENGTGLGLAICRSIVGDIGARMSITSEPGVGTTVALLLPVASGRTKEPPS